MGLNSEAMEAVRRQLKQIVYRLAAAIAGCGMLISCFPDPLLISGLPKVKPQIVVSTQIIPDESLVVLLTKTFGALDASEDSDPEELLEQIGVGDAIVVITGPTGSDTLLSIGNGLYGGISIPFAAGDEYHLYVKSESLGEVTSTTTVMAQVTFDDIEAELYSSSPDDTLAQITHAFTDPAGKNYYMLNVQEVEREDAVQNLLNPDAFTRLLPDDEFEGTKYQETFRVFPRDYSVGDTIAVSLSNVNKDYYDFLKLRMDNRFSLVEFLGEPLNYPSNVNGGKGYFNLYIPDVRVFVLE
jgi:hypothetical protein